LRSRRHPAFSARADWGYHVVDVNLALGNLVTDVAAAERAWSPHG
jgi:hypothetical protein